MTTGESGTPSEGSKEKRWFRPVLDVLTLLVLIGGAAIYWRQANIYADQLKEMRDQNLKTQQALTDSKAREEKHDRERKEDQERSANLDKENQERFAKLGRVDGFN